jgi:diguanylate cyclase (GGDEF)-like protein
MLRYAAFPGKTSMTSQTVLVADDSPLVVRMVEKLLLAAGLGVVTARDGLDAIEKAMTQDVSLVILDVLMPRMNGYQVCRLLKTEPATRSLPVVILTSRDQAGDRFWGLETGADFYITKDSEPQRIVELVKRVLEEQPARPAATEHPSSVDVLSRVNDLLDRKLYEATILSEIGRVARGLANFDETFTSVMAVVARVVDFTVGAMAFIEEDAADVLMMMNRPASQKVLDETRQRVVDALTRERGGAGFADVRTWLLASASRASEEVALGGFVGFPMVTHDQVSGLVALAGRAVERLAPETRTFLVQVASQAHTVVDNARLVNRLKELSIRDGLTDLFNHRHTLERVTEEYSRVARYHEALSVLMIDLDHFKEVNDRHGHQAGDRVLRETAAVFKEGLRAVDLLGRYGGEEFLALLPHTGLTEAASTAERLRRRLERHVFPVSEAGLKITASIGVSSYPAAGIDSADALVRAADDALYQAKQAGRNRVARAAAGAML